MSVKSKALRGIDSLIKVANTSPNHNQHAAGIYNRQGNLIVSAPNVWDDHAEHRAITRYFAVDKFRRQKASYIVVIRITKSGLDLAYSKPCNKCQRLLDELNIKVLHS